MIATFVNWDKFLVFFWLREQEDGAKVVRVENVNNPYRNQANFDKRFKLTLNKLYAWSLVDYDRVVMLDADNLFLQKTDELFQCGQFCAAFINPCIFHTGLFVLQVNLSFKHLYFYKRWVRYDLFEAPMTFPSNELYFIKFCIDSNLKVLGYVILSS